MRQNNWQIGLEGENAVKKQLLLDDFILIDSNFQYYRSGLRGRMGEIDLIFIKNKVLHFIEVKTRQSQLYGPAAGQINRAKLKHLYSAIAYFLIKHKEYKNMQMQFDVAIVTPSKVEIIWNAYQFDNM